MNWVRGRGSSVRVLLLAAGLAVVVVIVRQLGAATIAALLRRVGWRFAAVSALYTVHVAVRAAALWRCLPSEPSGPPAPEAEASMPRAAADARRAAAGGGVPATKSPPAFRYRDVLLVRLSGEAVEMLTFTGPFLAEPAKGVLLARRGLSGPQAFGAVAAEYLVYTAVSAALAAAALGVLLARRGLPPPLAAPVAAVEGGMLAFLAGFTWAALTGRGLIVPTLRAARLRALAARAAPIEAVMVTFLHARAGRLAEVLSLEAAGHALLVAEVWLVLAALGLPLAPLDPVLIEGGAKFISAAFFFVPGQVGAQEGIYALLLGAVGLPAAAGVTLSLVRRVRGLIVSGLAVGAVALAPAQQDRQAS